MLDLSYSRSIIAMPTYEYECEKCGDHFEQFQNISDDPLTTCPKEECKGSVHRIISPGAGFLFKGSGFYITDYRSDTYKKAAEADKPSSSSTSKKSDSKSSKSTKKKSSSTSKKTDKK